MKNFFDIIAPMYEKLHFGALKTFNKIELLTIFEPSDKVIDLGGGSGRIAKFLTNKVQQIIVVDTSKGMLKQCQRRYPGVACAQAEAQNLPFADNSMNKVIIIDAFHHFQNQKQVVKETERVLVKNGQVIIEEFNPLRMTGKLAVIMEKLFLMGSTFHTPLSLVNLFSGNGFKARLVDGNRMFYYLVGEKI